MTPQFGDIVVIPARADGVKWVVSPSGSPSHNHVPNVRLLRHGYGVWISHTVTINDVRTVERPTFDVGERVFINDRAARVVKMKDEGMIRVEYEPRRVPIGTSGLTRHDEGSQSDIALWHLSLDNRLDQGSLR